MDKTILLASFIFPERLDWFLNYLENKFGIPKDKVFVFKNLEDDSKFIVTFKFTIRDDKKVNFKNLFPNAILIHKKGTTIYTINALNKLIETELPGNVGNINYKSVKIEWEKYTNTILLYNNNNLNIYKIERVF